VNFVVIDAITPKNMPIRTPPKATTKNEVAPKTMSTPSIFSLPISEYAANSLYRTLIY
jgi:hypothetical protein